LSASTHSPVLKHHFDNLEQQHASERLGIWMFLATEVLFFGGLFGAYTVYRFYNPTEFEFASSNLNRTIATINTLFLITSSLTITLGIRAAKLGQRAALIRWLLITAALGTAFMVMKGFEYAEDFHERYVPGSIFRGEYDSAEEELKAEARSRQEAGLPPLTAKQISDYHFKREPQHWAAELVKNNTLHAIGEPGRIDAGKVQLFLCFYYIMTGIHGIHILVGIGCILWLVWEARRGTIPPENYSTVEVVSLYWHLVDAIWLFLMPLLYLAGAGFGKGH
jgi:cytochrome c oxidase subunit III